MKSIKEKSITHLLNNTILGENEMSFFREALSMEDLDPYAISNLTQTHLDDRYNNPEADSRIEFIEGKIDSGHDYITLYFKVYPTYNGRVKVLTTSAAEYSGTFYNVVFRFFDISQYITDYNNITKEQIQNVFWHCNVKLYSNDASWFYQGHWEDMANEDASLFPFPGPQGKGQWRGTHQSSGGLKNPKIRITKHMAAVLLELPKLLGDIISKIKVI